jgi:hypothetical protein
VLDNVRQLEESSRLKRILQEPRRRPVEPRFELQNRRIFPSRYADRFQVAAE